MRFWRRCHECNETPCFCLDTLLPVHCGGNSRIRLLPSSLATHHAEGALIEVTELLAIVSGLFMLLGRNWARWLALAWMAFHLAISFPIVRQVISHSIILGLIAWLLFRQDARRYFQPLNGNSE